MKALSMPAADVMEKLSPEAQELLLKMARGTQTVTHLAGAPLELISRDFARFEFIAHSYEMRIPARGIDICRSLPR